MGFAGRTSTTRFGWALRAGFGHSRSWKRENPADQIRRARLRRERFEREDWLPDKGSNLGPTDPESVALPTELSGSVLSDYPFQHEMSRCERAQELTFRECDLRWRCKHGLAGVERIELMFQAPKRLIRIIRVVEPLAERVPLLTFRAITAGRTALSAALLSEGTPSQSTKENSSPRKVSIRLARTLCGALTAIGQ